jgi:Na+/proline symporter
MSDIERSSAKFGMIIAAVLVALYGAMAGVWAVAATHEPEQTIAVTTE